MSSLNIPCTPISSPAGSAPPISSQAFSTAASIDPSIFHSEILKGRQVYFWKEEYTDAFQGWWKNKRWYESQTKYPTRRNIRWGPQYKQAEGYWQYFDEGADVEDGKPRAICKRCKMPLTHPSGGGGGGILTSHIKSSEQCRNVSREQGLHQISLQQTVTQKNRDFQSRLDNASEIPFLRKHFEHHLLNALIGGAIPFQQLDNPLLRRAFRCLDSTINFPSDTTFRRRLQDRANHIRAHQLDNLLNETQKVALSLDTWSAQYTRQGFLAVRVHFLDASWTLHDRLLEFEPLTGSHTGEALANTVCRILDQYHLKNRIAAFTSDNASNNETLQQELNRVIANENNTLGLTSGHSLERFPCLAHVINLVVKALLESLKFAPTNEDFQMQYEESRESSDFYSLGGPNEREQSMTVGLYRMRKTAVRINSSSQRRELFEAIQEQLISDDQLHIKSKKPVKVPQDVKTRWDSTYYMIQRFIRLEPAIRQWYEKDVCTYLRLSESQWRQMKYLCDILEPFARKTQAFSRATEPTIQHVFTAYNSLFDHLDRVDRLLYRKKEKWQQEICVALQNCRSKLHNYYGLTSKSFGKIYGFAILLTPAYRLNYFTNDLATWGTRRQTRANVQENTEALSDEEDLSNDFEHYGEYYAEELIEFFDEYYQDILPLPQPTTSTPRITEVDELAIMVTNPATETESDEHPIKAFLNSQSLGIAGNEKLSLQWRSVEPQHPRAAQVARDILAIPAAGVSCERTFSTVRAIWKWNQQFSPETIRDLVLVRSYEKALLTTKEEELVTEGYLARTIAEAEVEIQEQKEEEGQKKRSDEFVYISEDENEQADEESIHIRTGKRKKSGDQKGKKKRGKK